MNRLNNDLIDNKKQAGKEDQRTQKSENSSGNFSGELWQLLGRYFGDYKITGSLESSSPHPPSVKPTGDRSFLLSVLRIYPGLLLGLFFYSFYWDFNGLSLSLIGTVYPLDGLLRIITVSGLIGFLTNWLAITMLFRPASRRPLLGHGLIPAHKDRIAKRLALAVSDDLINPEIIKKRIQKSESISRYREAAILYFKSAFDNPQFRTDLKNLVVSYVDDMIRDPEIRTGIARKVISEIDEAIQERSLESVAIKTYTFLKGKEMQDLIEEALIHLPASVEKGFGQLDDVLDRIPVYMEQESDQIENFVTTLIYRLVNQLDVYSLVEENLKHYDEGRLEQMIRGATNEQLRYIQYLGAILGTIGGLVIWQPLISLTALVILFFIVVAVDKSIMMTGKK